MGEIGRMLPRNESSSMLGEGIAMAVKNGPDHVSISRYRAPDGNLAARFCLIAAVLTALWSLYTTWLGMDLIVKNVVGAAVFSTIVQAWLLGVSLVLGAAFAHRFLH